MFIIPNLISKAHGGIFGSGELSSMSLGIISNSNRIVFYRSIVVIVAAMTSIIIDGNVVGTATAGHFL